MTDRTPLRPDARRSNGVSRQTSCAPPGTTAGELIKQKIEWLVPFSISALAPIRSNSLDLTEGYINFRRFEL